MKNNDGRKEHHDDSGESAPSSIVINNNHTHRSADTPSNNQTNPKPREPRALIIWTAVLAIGTLIMGGAAVWSDFLIKDTGERQLRAYLDVKSTGSPVLNINQPAVVYFAIRNSGLTPAYHVTPRPAAEIRSYPEPRVEINFSRGYCG
jgi:hypothetical protein